MKEAIVGVTCAFLLVASLLVINDHVTHFTWFGHQIAVVH